MLKNLPDRINSKFIQPLVLQKKYGQILAANKKLKNSKAGKRCFIIATGPSLKDQDLTNLYNEETFVVNTFWKHQDYKKINPKYYVVTDTYNFPNEETRGSAWVQDLLDRNEIVSSLPTKLFFHAVGKPYIENQKLFPNNDIYYLAFHRFFTDNLKFNTEIDKILPNTKNVVIACLIIAVYMGFEEIYLLGCDHSFLAYPSQNHYDGFKHFYETTYKATNQEDVKNFALDVMPYERHIDHAKILFKNYRLLSAKLAKTNPKVKIYNATPNSFLDVFPYKKYEDIKL